ncbi:nucleotide pyrophosphohydrolase [Lachnospiraceae bacterium OttesenSCG-928-E19]|nr:nucleotide pyrophosphohydrolase [Lachnospiraceae bacterium OttesenSCG-928-E19]
MKEETIQKILQFRDERNWKQFHNPKDLAISISLEAAELLEVFQWSAEDVNCTEKLDKIKEELADVVNYCVLMADTCGLDLDDIVLEKIKRNNEKYPVELAKDSKKKYSERDIKSSF